MANFQWVLTWEFIFEHLWDAVRNDLVELLVDKINEPIHRDWPRGQLASMVRQYRRRWRTLNHICQQWENEGYTVPDTRGVYHIDWINIQRGVYHQDLVDHWCNAEFAADLEIYEDVEAMEELMSWDVAPARIGFELLYPPYCEAGCVLIHMIRFQILSQARALWQAPHLGVRRPR